MCLKPLHWACVVLPQRWLPIITSQWDAWLAANLLTEVCSNVCIEPEQPATVRGNIKLNYDTANKEIRACLDIVTSGPWGSQSERTFVDVWVFNPHTPPNNNASFVLQEAWENEEESLWAKYSGSWTYLIHFHRLLSNGWDGQWGNSFLQENGIQPSCKMGSVLQLHHVLVLLPDNTLLVKIDHSVPSRCALGHAQRFISPIDLVTSESQIPYDY